MILLVGLGNPGAKYARNRHNAGFLAMDAIADAHHFSPSRSKFQGEIREGKLGTEKVLILKPTTFYNESGNSVAAAARFHKIPVDQIVVFHDEIDLAPGKIRMKKGGGLAGNNGLKSTAAHLGPDFWRVRMGVGHPGRKEAVTGHVLGDFSKAEHADWLDDTLRRMGDAAIHLVGLDDEAAGRFMSGIAQPGAKATTAPKTPKSETAPPASTATPKKNDKASSPFADLLKGLRDKT